MSEIEAKVKEALGVGARPAAVTEDAPEEGE
jgi:hypothetical protein